jgi:hypothetical protein
MIDPYTQGLMKDKEPIDLRRAPADINEILLLDILAFVEERGLRGGELLTSVPEERYLELMSNLFNDYVAKRGVDLQKLDIEKAKFAKGPEFNLNLDLIKNQRTREILQKSESLQNLYKIMVGSLRKKRNPERVGSIMTPSVVGDFNKMIDKITDTINKETDGKFKTFGDYLNTKVTESVGYKDLEDLVVEEKVINYNKFIHLGKVAINEEKGKTLIKNKKTGDEYEVKNPDPKKHEIVGPKDKSDNTKETQSSLSEKTKKKIDSKADELKKDFSRVAFSSTKDKEEFSKGFTKLLDGKKLTDEEAKLVSKYAKLSDSKGRLRIYFASSEPGKFKQGTRENVMDVSDKDGSMRKEFEDLGMEVTPATTVGGSVKAKVGGKDLNPAKIAGGKTYKPDVKVTKDDDGNIQEITIGSTRIKRLTTPNQDKLLEAVKAQNPDFTDKEAVNLAGRTNRAIERHNKNLSKWEKLNEFEMIETVPGLDKLPQKERSEKIAKEYPLVIGKKLKELLGDNPTEKELAVLKSIEDLSKIESVEDFDEAAINVLREIDDIESIKKGSSSMAESFAYISMNRRGYRTELPAGENFPVADVISLGGDLDINDIDPDSPDYATKVAMVGLGLAVNLETMGGISVKKDGGAASALRNKIAASQFANKETADKLTALADNHNNFMGTLKEPTTLESIKKGNAILDETEEWAVKNGIINKEDLPFTYGAKNRTAEEWADDTIKDWESKGKGPFPKYQREALAGHLRASLLVAAVHNGDLVGQDYGNINMSTSKKDGGLHITDGVTTASLMKPSPNPGFSFVTVDGETMVRPNATYSANLVHSDYDPANGRFKPLK